MRANDVGGQRVEKKECIRIAMQIDGRRDYFDICWGIFRKLGELATARVLKTQI